MLSKASFSQIKKKMLKVIFGKKIQIFVSKENESRMKWRERRGNEQRKPLAG